MWSKRNYFHLLSLPPFLTRRRLTIFYFTGTEQVAEPQKPMKAKQRFLIERSVGSKSFHVFRNSFGKIFHSEKWVGFGLKVVCVCLYMVGYCGCFYLFPQCSLLMQTLILSTTRIPSKSKSFQINCNF